MAWHLASHAAYHALCAQAKGLSLGYDAAYHAGNIYIPGRAYAHCLSVSWPSWLACMSLTRLGSSPFVQV